MTQKSQKLDFLIFLIFQASGATKCRKDPLLFQNSSSRKLKFVIQLGHAVGYNYTEGIYYTGCSINPGAYF